MTTKTKTDEEKLQEFGKRLVSVLGLRPMDGYYHEPHYFLTEGFASKTSAGVARVVLRLMEESEVTPDMGD